MDRFAAAGLDLTNRVSMIGRPDQPSVPIPTESSGPVVLYAPTWEGFHLDQALSSMPKGAALVAIVQARSEPTGIIVRPHPLTGTVDGGYREAMTSAADQIEPRSDGLIRMFDEPGGSHSLAWGFARSDVLITDVSSVLVDYLATGKPIVLIAPAGVDLDTVAAEYPMAKASYVVAADLAGLQEAIDVALDADPLANVRFDMRDYYLGRSGDVAAALSSAIDAVVSAQDPGDEATTEEVS